MCNIAIKQGLKSPEGSLKLRNPKTGMLHIIKSAEDVIDLNEASMTTHEDFNKANPEPEDHKAQREKENAVIVKKCKEKSDRRKYNELTGKIAGFQNQAEIEMRHAK